MLPAAPHGGASPPVPYASSGARVFVPPQRPASAPGLVDDRVLLALPHTAASASTLRSLRAEGVEASHAGDGMAALDAVRRGRPALVVLDVELPGPDPVGLLDAIHSELPAVPVLVVTPRERRATVLARLRGDRDDYVVRPFAIDELAARVRFRLRLIPPADPAVLRQGELVVDTELGDVTVLGRPVSLTPTEYALLMALLHTPGEVVAPASLAREVWSEPASANLVQVYISYLRRKIGPERIRTVRGEGYVLEA